MPRPNTSSSSSSQSKLDVDGVFVEMGYIAKTDFVKGLVQLNNSNEIIVDKYCATSRQGIFKPVMLRMYHTNKL